MMKKIISTALLLSTLFGCGPQEHKSSNKNVVLDNVSTNMTSYNVVNLKFHYLNRHIFFENKITDFKSSLTIGNKNVEYTTHVVSDTTKTSESTYRVGYTSEDLKNNAVIELGSIKKCFENENYESVEQTIINTDLHEGAHLQYWNIFKKEKSSVNGEMFSMLVELSACTNPVETLDKLKILSNNYLYTDRHALASKLILYQFDKHTRKFPFWKSGITEISKHLLYKNFNVPLDAEIVHKTGFQSEEFFSKHYQK